MEWNQDAYDTLIQRRDWLRERIEAKRKVGWQTCWDIREMNALAWAIEQLKRLKG